MTINQLRFHFLSRNIFPDNLVKATFSKSQTKNSLAFKNVHKNDTNGSWTETVSFMQKSVEDANGVNVIGKYNNKIYFLFLIFFLSYSYKVFHIRKP